ncbi:MAG: hypothetical protein R3C03_21560 [Pirellulaceae bacterium]
MGIRIDGICIAEGVTAYVLLQDAVDQEEGLSGSGGVSVVSFQTVAPSGQARLGAVQTTTVDSGPNAMV